MVNAWHHRQLGLQPAWKQFGTRGAGVTVALVDTGVADISPLRHVRRFSCDGAEQGAAGHDRSPSAHGTRMAAIIAARSRKLPGVAQDSEFLAFCAADVAGEPLPSLIGRALSAAVRRGADLICCASTLSSSSRELEDGLAEAASAGVPVLAAAGNDPGVAPVFPVEAPGVIVVGATTRADKISRQYRWERWMPIAAPGQRVRTWDGLGASSSSFSGTSAAAPIVAGVVALGLASARALDPSGALTARIKARLGPLLRETSRSPASHRRVDPRAFLTAIAALAGDTTG